MKGTMNIINATTIATTIFNNGIVLVYSSTSFNNVTNYGEFQLYKNGCSCNYSSNTNKCTLQTNSIDCSSSLNCAQVSSTNSTCVNLNNVTCNLNQNQCSFFYCNGVASTDPSVCSGKGTCVSTDNCNCNNGYYSNNCNVTTCYSILSNSSGVCSGLFIFII
jgi:hypothetical protein